MAKMWVQAVTVVHYDKDGVMEVAHPGDWFEIGKHQARKLMAQKRVVIPRADRKLIAVDYEHSGVVVRSQGVPNVSSLKELAGKLPFVNGLSGVPFDYTLVWETSLPVAPHSVELGLTRCRASGDEGWEVLAMLTGEMTMANAIGSEAEQAKTGQVVKDLRTPVYEPRLVWLCQSPATEELVKLWAAELESKANEHHAFLRSLYQSGAKVRALPSNWQALQEQRWRR